MPTLYRLILLISSSLFAMSSSAAEDRSATEQSAATQAIPAPARSPLVSRNIAAAQAVQLSAEAQQLITLTTPREHFSVLFLAANQPESRGMLILLPGVGESFDWPTAISPLRNKLPDAGWDTLSINLPSSPAPELSSTAIIASPVAEQIIVEPPASPEPPTEPPVESEPEPEPAAAEEPDQAAPIEALPDEATNDESTSEPAAPVIEVLPPLTYPERINSFIEAAINYAQEQHATEIILLGHHEGAYWALNYALEYPAATPLRVALIAPRTNDQGASSYENLIKANTSSISDFYYKGDRALEAAAKQRLQASKQAGLKNYHQVGLTAIHTSLEQEQLFRRVKGWLNKP